MVALTKGADHCDPLWDILSLKYQNAAVLKSKAIKQAKDIVYVLEQENLDPNHTLKYRKNYTAMQGTVHRDERQPFHFCSERERQFPHYRVQGHKKNCQSMWYSTVTGSFINGPIAKKIHRYRNVVTRSRKPFHFSSERECQIPHYRA